MALTLMEDVSRALVSAVYVPPRHKIASQMWEEYFQDLEDKYIAAGDYNSKHYAMGVKKPYTSRQNTGKIH